MPLSEEFDAALLYASDMHRDQIRKGSGAPYLLHLLQVAGLALEHGADEQVAIAALLHDVVEDCGKETIDVIQEEFGERVLAIVLGCSDTTDKVAETRSWRERKETYLAHLREAASADVLLVSCCDKLHNSRSILSDLKEQGESIWDIFKGGRDGTLWYYRALVDAYRQVDAPPRLVRELDEVVSEIERLAGNK
jgi:(p)ppGpp synthase/HD superfamily hydrolase